MADGKFKDNRYADQKSATTEDDYKSIAGLGSLLDSVPELAQLVNQAVASGWTAAKFQNMVEDSGWWQDHSATARSIIIERANDPKTYQQNLNNAKSSIESLAHQLGMTLTTQEVQAISSHALLTGNESNQAWLTTRISSREDYSHLKNIGSLEGGMAATATQLQQLSSAYGMRWTPAQIAQRAQNVVSGATTVDTYQADAINWAKSAFPGLAKQIDAGQTISQLADPYVQSMSSLLEVDPGALNIYTPKIRAAMQGYTDPHTKDRVPMNLADFEKQVRHDPRWQYTQNAKDTMSSALVKIGADFGFGPEG